MTLNGHFSLNSVFRRQAYVWSSEAAGFRSMDTLKRVCCTVNFKPSEQLRHRAVSLRQHGFIVFCRRNNTETYVRHVLRPMNRLIYLRTQRMNFSYAKTHATVAITTTAYPFITF